MARILILGGGFAGVVAAESLVQQLGDEHQITLVARSDQFVFYPALVRLALGKCQPGDVSFDLRKSMLSRRINFIEAEIAHLDLEQRKVIIAHGEIEGNIPYDYLIFALGRRLATEEVTGFFEHSHHVLNLDGAMRFGEALRTFQGGQVVIGQCPGARLPVPVYETAFALSSQFQANISKITVVGPGTVDSEFEDPKLALLLGQALDRNGIEHLPNFPIARVDAGRIVTTDGRDRMSDLLMLIPPFRGAAAASRLGITNDDGYINVDWKMKVIGVDRMYAVGDCVNFSGPKMGHMAVGQAEVAAANLASELLGQYPLADYNHEAMMVIDAADNGSFYFHKDLWSSDPASVHQGRFWSWAKRAQEKYWKVTHV